MFIYISLGWLAPPNPDPPPSVATFAPIPNCPRAIDSATIPQALSTCLKDGNSTHLLDGILLARAASKISASRMRRCIIILCSNIDHGLSCNSSCRAFLLLLKVSRSSVSWSLKLLTCWFECGSRLEMAGFLIYIQLPTEEALAVLVRRRARNCETVSACFLWG